MRISYYSRRSPRDEQSSNFFRRDIRGLNVDMAINQSGGSILPFRIYHLHTLIIADSYDIPICNGYAFSLDYRRIVDINYFAVFNNQISRDSSRRRIYPFFQQMFFHIYRLSLILLSELDSVL
jgi:hypothetical protein